MTKTPVALVTGAARRVGAAIALGLHEAGFCVALHCYQSVNEAEILCQQFNHLHSASAAVFQSDLGGTPDSLAELVETVVRQWGRLDLLVNNASRFYPCALSEGTKASWQDMMAVNVEAPWFLSKAAAPFLGKQQGSIVNICDIHGEQPLSGYGIYCMSKAALVMQTRVLAKELAPVVRVNGVSPGAMLWPEGVNALDVSTQEEILARVPLKRHGEPADIAHAVCFLACHAPWMTGQVIRVDGGRLRRP